MKRAWIGVVGTLALMGAAGAGCEGAEPPVVVTTPGGEVLENPPAISGGTLAITRDKTLLVAADPDVDQIHVIGTADTTELSTIALEEGDEPGRVLEGADHVMYVALRRAGAIARLDLESGELTRADACPAPRGMAYDDAAAQLHVACAGGELVTLSADLEPVRTLYLERDLRDVLIAGDKLVVSLFRSAEVLVLDDAGAILHRMSPPKFVSFQGRNFAPAVAWRMQLLPSGMVAVVHQRGLSDVVPIGGTDQFGTSSYGGSCDDGIVNAAVTVFDPSTGGIVNGENTGGVGTLVLPVDVAVSESGRVAVVGAGSDRLFESPVDDLLNSDAVDNCFPGQNQRDVELLGEPIAVVYGPDGDLFVQTRQPAAVHRVNPANATFDEFGGREGPVGGTGMKVEPSASAMFSGMSRRHLGHALFHKAASPQSPVACASCHPEGRDDGRVWQFEEIGLRRTQNLGGGVLETLPLHWDGKLTNLHDLMGEVFVDRMGGAAPPADREDELGQWIDRLPLVPNSDATDFEAVSRGEAIFHDPAVGCAGCHSGETLTNNATVAVGTGQELQVPSLRGVAHRAPYMHDGCAKTLTERFQPGSCSGGDMHGQTSQLTTDEISDLVAYLETL